MVPRCAAIFATRETARVALLGEKAVVDELQIDRAPHQRHRHRRRAGPASRYARQRNAASDCVCRGRSSPHVRARSRAFAAAQNGKRCIMARRSRCLSAAASPCGAWCSRTRSTNAWVDQALCSSCSWPHSISRLSRRLFRPLELDEQLARAMLGVDRPRGASRARRPTAPARAIAQNSSA